MSDYSMFDIIGPVMIGPSSSHTAGAARLGKMAHKFVGDEIKSVKFYLHGSFAKTYRGHGTDKALLAGVLGFSESDDQLKMAFQIAKEKGVPYEFIETDLGEVHPNSVNIVVEKKDGTTVSLVGSSIGGGNIRVIQLNGIDLDISGEHPTIVARHSACKGIITGITNLMTTYDYDILYMSFHKKNVGDEGVVVVEVSERPDADILEAIKKINGISDVYVI